VESVAPFFGEHCAPADGEPCTADAAVGACIGNRPESGTAHVTDLLDLAKPIVAMVHLPPLPGAPLHDRAGGMQAIVEHAARDLEALQAGGVDAVMFGNEGDRPYQLQAAPETLAAMAAAIGVLKPRVRVPFGVDCLWDPIATVALAVATGASFAREIFTGVYAADMGVWQPRGAEALRLRASLGRPDLRLLFNVNAEFATSLDTRPIEVRARSAVFSSLADVICVSGPMTGMGVELSDLARVKAAVPETPVFANTGVRLDTVEEILSTADGCVVGTHFKVEGDTWKPVDPARVGRFMDHVRELRARS
jgi:membrane complex biogenesis BtpA family protein